MTATDSTSPEPGEAGAEPRARPIVRPGLLALTRAFGLVGITSIGGGRFTFFYHEFVKRRRWLSEAQILEDFGVSQVLPGPNIGNFAVVLGQRLRGLRGAVLALAALLAPGAVLMLVLSALYFSRGEVPALSSILRGVAAAAAGMTAATALQVGQQLGRSLRGILLALITLLAIAILHLPTVLTIVALGLAGILLFRPTAPHA